MQDCEEQVPIGEGEAVAMLEADRVTTPRRQPELESFPPDLAARVAMTVSCGDADNIPKVDNAGETAISNGTRVQVMHNGLVIEEGCYFGPWMTEIIRCLRGHHEPQEEAVFHAILERLAQESATQPRTIIELGSFWAYYSLWFARWFPDARVVALEPDPEFLDVGRRNFALNDMSATFVHGAIERTDGDSVAFSAESDGRVHMVPSYTLDSLMRSTGVERCDLVLADIQGAETALLESAEALLSAGLVRFLVVSTHHYSISGQPLTHQNALKFLEGLGGHVIAEHAVGESYSGDGLIAMSFDARDKDLEVQVSHARQRESLFGELEYAVAQEMSTSTRLNHENTRLAGKLRGTQDELNVLRNEIHAIRATKLWRWSHLPRSLYARLGR